jgi:hypothetical protein
MPAKKAGAKALGGLTLARGIGPQDIKLLNKLTSDSVGVGIFSSIGLTSSQFVELGRFDFSSWEDLVKRKLMAGSRSRPPPPPPPPPPQRGHHRSRPSRITASALRHSGIIYAYVQ